MDGQDGDLCLEEKFFGYFYMWVMGKFKMIDN